MIVIGVIILTILSAFTVSVIRHNHMVLQITKRAEKTDREVMLEQQLKVEISKRQSYERALGLSLIEPNTTDDLFGRGVQGDELAIDILIEKLNMGLIEPREEEFKKIDRYS